MVIGFLAVVAGAMLIPVYHGYREIGPLMDLCHAPVFGALAWLLRRGLAARLPNRPWAAWSLVVVAVGAFGLAMEGIQALTGRSASWHDGIADLLGAAGAMGLSALWEARHWELKAGGVLLASAALAAASAIPIATLVDCRDQRRLPSILASFETPWEMTRWSVDEARYARSREHVMQGEWSLCLDLEPGVYPGASLIWPTRDWSGHEQVAFDVWLDTFQPVALVVKVEDARHNHTYEDRYERPVRLVPGQQTIRIRLDEVRDAPQQRLLNLRHVKVLQVFVVRPSSPIRLYLDNLRLE
jgi:hypothetical protein